MVLEILFFILSNKDIQFIKKNLSEDKNIKAFVVYIIFLNLNLIPIHLAQEAQIALLVIEKVQIPSEYLNFLDIFSKKKGFNLIGGNRPKLTHY